MDIALVAAIAENDAFGYQGKLPWRLKGELAVFKRITMGHAVIMGRKTYDSLPMRRPLPGRQNIVISRTVQEIDGAIVCSTLESALTTAKIWDQAQLESQRIAMVIGGAEIFRLAMPHATLFYRTLVALKPKADVFFHDFDRT